LLFHAETRTTARVRGTASDVANWLANWLSNGAKPDDPEEAGLLQVSGEISPPEQQKIVGVVGGEESCASTAISISVGPRALGLLSASPREPSFSRPYENGPGALMRPEAVPYLRIPVSP